MAFILCMGHFINSKTKETQDMNGKNLSITVVVQMWSWYSLCHSKKHRRNEPWVSLLARIVFVQ
jgi:hypothetical protein